MGLDLGKARPASAPALMDEPGEPFGIGGEPVLGQEASRSSPAACFDGENYLVVWEDVRDGVPDIFAARVTQSGEILDPVGIPVSSGISPKARPAVAFDGANFLVLWADARNGSWDIYGSRVSRSGAVLDPEGLAIIADSGDQLCPALAYSESRYLVAWSDQGTGWINIRGAVLNSGGSVLGEGILISPGVAQSHPGGPWGPAVAADGSTFMVVWQARIGDDWNVYGARISTSGEILDPSRIDIATTADEEWYPWVSHNGSHYFVVWHGIFDGSFDLFGARLSSAGELLDSERIAVSEHRFWQRYPAVTSDGEDYLVVWANWTAWAQDVYSTLVTSSGEVVEILGTPVINAKTDVQWRPAVVFGGDNYLIISQDERTASGADVHGVFVDRSGMIVGGGVRISTEGDGPWRPRASFNGSNYMVVWGDIGEGVGRISGARVSASGSLLDSEGIPISQEAYGAYAPDIAFDGTTHMVVWQDDRGGDWDIYGARMNRLGVVLNEGGRQLSFGEGDERNPSIAYGAGVYFVAWESRRSGGYDIYGARVDPTGAVIDSEGIAISTASKAQRHPALTFDGENFLVLWEDKRNGSWDIYGSRMTVSGEVLDAGGLMISGSDGHQLDPMAASDGAEYLVVWQDWNGGSSDVRGSRVSSSGEVLGPGEIYISARAGREWGPDVAFNGREYVVAWGDERRGSANVDVYASRIATNGLVLDPEGVGISTDLDSQLLPSVVPGDGAEVLTVHSSFKPSAIFGYTRVWGSLWSPSEEDPLELTLSVHQNPVLTSEVDILMIPSKAVQDTSVWIVVDDTTIETALTDTTAGIYRGSYRLTRPDVVTIICGARDLLGTSATASRQFGVGAISRAGGGVVEGPHGIVSLRFPDGSVDRDCYILVMYEPVPAGGAFPSSVERVESFPEDNPSDPSGSPRPFSFLLSPGSIDLRERAILSVNLVASGTAWVPMSAGGAGGGGSIPEPMSFRSPVERSKLTPELLREGPCGWEKMSCAFDAERKTLTAQIEELGRFAVIWSPKEAGPPRPGLRLVAVPNPFQTALEVGFLMPAGGEAEICVYDPEGRLVRALFKGHRDPGWQREIWDGLDDAGRRAPAGVYFTTVRAHARTEVAKCVLVR